MESREFGAAIWSTKPEPCFSATRVVGTASFSSAEGVSLEIPIGSLLELQDGRAAVFCDIGETERAYGYNQNGDCITLIDLFRTRSSFNGAGIAKESWRAESALVSHHEFHETDPVVSEATVSIDGLFEWVGSSPVKGATRLSVDGRWVDTTYSASAESLEETVLYKADAYEVWLCPKVTDGGGQLPRKTVSLTGDYQLKFRFQNNYPRLQDAMSNVVIPFRDFLSLLMGYRAEILKASFLPPDSAHEISYYARLVETAANNRPKGAYREMPFPYSEVAATLQPMAEKWLSLDSDAARAAKTLLGVMTYGRNVFLDSKFVALASAFEALARVGNKTRELSDDEFNRRLGCVEEGVFDKKARDWAMRKLRNSNFVSAGNLTSEMLRGLEPFVSWLVPDAERFKTDHRVSRNAYVHQNEHLGDDCLEGKGLYHHTSGVRLIAYAKLMSLLGVAPEKTKERLVDSNYQAYAVRCVQRMYALNLGD